VKNNQTCGIKKIKVTSLKQLKEIIEKSPNGADFNLYVSTLTSMNGLLAGSDFKGDISGLDVSNVTDVDLIFGHAKFNGYVSKWKNT